jgi:hypothetical protein
MCQASNAPQYLHLGIQVLLGPSKLVNKNFGTLIVLVLTCGELITFLAPLPILALFNTSKLKLTNLDSDIYVTIWTVVG